MMLAVPFLIILAYAFLCVFFRTLTDRQSLFVCVIIAIVFSGFMMQRSLTISDTINYIDIFNSIEWSRNANFSLWQDFESYDIECGFAWLIISLKFIGIKSYRIFFFLIALFNSLGTTVGIQKFIEKDCSGDGQPLTLKKYGLLICLYISYFGFYYSGIALRAGLSMTLIVFAINSFRDRHVCRGLIFLLISISIHRLAVLGLVVYLTYKYFPKMTKGKFLVSWLIITVLNIFSIAFSLSSFGRNVLMMMGTRLNSYDYIRYLSQTENSVSLFVIALLLLGGAFAWLGYDDESYRLFNVYGMGYLITAILSGIKGYSRIVDYFLIFGVALVYSLYLKKIKEPGNNKIYINVLTILYVLFNLIRSYNLYY